MTPSERYHSARKLPFRLARLFWFNTPRPHRRGFDYADLVSEAQLALWQWAGAAETDEQFRKGKWWRTHRPVRQWLSVTLTGIRRGLDPRARRPDFDALDLRTHSCAGSQEDVAEAMWLLRKLNTNQATVAMLRAQGHTYDRIGEMLGVSGQAALNQMNRGVKRLWRAGYTHRKTTAASMWSKEAP